MKKLSVIFILLCGMAAVVSCDDDDDQPMTTIPESDRMFVSSAADGGMFEVKAGEMAVSKGDSSKTGVVMAGDSMSIRSFGQMMVTDHTKANNELKTIADRKEVAIPATLSDAKQKMLDSLSAASGAAFNGMYTRMMVSSHRETVALFEKESSSGQDQDLKSWAGATLPTLKHHLEMAEMMHDQ